MTKSAGICELKENGLSWQVVVAVSANGKKQERHNSTKS